MHRAPTGEAHEIQVGSDLGQQITVGE